MRLIDADALKEKKVYSHERHEKIVPVAEIDWSPTIDAIPVAWVEEQRDRIRDIPRRGKGIARIIDWLLAMWQKEQEAR